MVTYRAVPSIKGRGGIVQCQYEIGGAFLNVEEYRSFDKTRIRSYELAKVEGVFIFSPYAGCYIPN